jgi:hypothetical protein
MSEANGVDGRRRQGRVEAERLVVEFERSGLTRQAFCAQHGLSAGSLDNYRRRRQAVEYGQVRAQPTGANRILPVELVSGAKPSAAESRSALWVELGKGRRIEVGWGFDATILERLIAVLERA